MKIRNLLIWTAALLAFGLSFSPANALLPPPSPDTQHFEITQGKVTVQPVFCRQPCEAQSGEFTGRFDAVFIRDQILLSNIVLKSEVDFTLPEDPYTGVGGAVHHAKHYFDGRTLVLEGTTDSSAFDGPIVTYSLVAEIAGEASVGFDPHGYYLARQDYRKCAAPLCGGIYLKAVNGRALQCLDGRRQRECYVGTPDWGKLGFNPFAEAASEELLLKGQLFDDVELGRFVATEAASAAGKGKTKGTFYAVENNGLVCISSPCFSFDEYTLNSKKPPQAISDVDLSHTGASDKAIEIAYQLMANDEPVVIVGTNHRYRGFSGIGVRLVASQFYLPVKPAARECPEGYTKGELGCETRNGCLFPLLEQVVYSGVRPELGGFPPYSECVTHCQEPAMENGPGYCALYLP